jgi:DNA invertase Pin-like site-specific DNA recombinase
MEQEMEGAVSAVKVSSPEVGGEDVVVAEERWQELQRLKAGGMTVSGISRATGLDRKTVRRCLRQVRWQAAGAAGGVARRAS